MDVYLIGDQYLFEVAVCDLENQPVVGESITVFAWNQTTNKFAGIDNVFDEDNEVALPLTERTGQTSFAGRYYRALTMSAAGTYWFVCIKTISGVNYRYTQAIRVVDWLREIWTQDMASMSGEADRSPLNAIRTLRNKVETPTETGTMTVYKENDTTEAWTAEATIDRTAGPITKVEPTA